MAPSKLVSFRFPHELDRRMRLMASERLQSASVLVADLLRREWNARKPPPPVVEDPEARKLRVAAMQRRSYAFWQRHGVMGETVNWRPPQLVKPAAPVASQGRAVSEADEYEYKQRLHTYITRYRLQEGLEDPGDYGAAVAWLKLEETRWASPYAADYQQLREVNRTRVEMDLPRMEMHDDWQEWLEAHRHLAGEGADDRAASRGDEHGDAPAQRVYDLHDGGDGGPDHSPAADPFADGFVSDEASMGPG